MSRVHVDVGLSDRPCGACSTCCVHLPIPAGLVAPVGKPAGAVCPHLRRGECGVYSRRPKACVDFRCAWLADTTWPETWRPDCSGLLCLRERLNGVPAAAVYEVKRGALRQSAAAEILAELKRTTAFVVVIDAQQHRQRLVGDWSVDRPHPTVPAPHFLRRHRADPEAPSTQAAHRDSH